MKDGDTIAAIASGAGPAGVCVIRVSGPATFPIVAKVFSCRAPALADRQPGTFVLGRVMDGVTAVDEALALIMRAPASYTGENTVEIQCHGGNTQSRRVLRVLLEAGARLAEPGEFTKRAFLNGRMDLLQAEAVQDIIQAKTERAARSAAEQLQGRLSSTLNSLYDQMLNTAAKVEAALDFPEEELPHVVLKEVVVDILIIQSNMDALLSRWDEGHILRDGAAVVIHGRPNAGKSTLMNALLGRNRAIVSPIPGTTRDTVEETFVLDGLPLRLIDTAGLRESACEIEKEGIRRTLEKLEAADLRLYVVDASERLHEDDLVVLARLSDEDIVVFNKVDLGSKGYQRGCTKAAEIVTSLQTGSGLPELKEAIRRRFQAHCHYEGQATLSERHRQLLSAALLLTREAGELLQRQGESAAATASSAMREALLLIGRITGRVYEDDLLDAIFSKFCIGK